MRKIVAIVAAMIILTGGGISADSPKPFQPTWTSLRNHDIPDWLRDAKFGLYSHWGIQTLQYQKENENLGLDELIAKFTAEKFDPKAWAELYTSAGARFAGPIAWHGSKYLHWDSAINEYNSVRMSPHIDIVGELEREIKKAGLKFFISLHSAQHDNWVECAREAIDKYHPDIFWVDASFGGTKGGHHRKTLNKSMYIGEGEVRPTALSDRDQRDVIAHFYNAGLQNNQQVQFIYKSYDIPPGVGMRDLENGLLDDIAYDTWMTDIDMNICPDWETSGWFFREGIPLRSANNIIDVLCDVVSKNGIFLLNVPPRADGTFNDEVKTTLAEVGDWLKINGEAIYGSSPWFIFGEGPTVVESRNGVYHHNDHFSTHHFTEQDIRYTVNGEFLYAICLGWPDEQLVIRSLNSQFKVKKGEIKSVTLLGTDENLIWRHDERGLVIDLPEQPVSEYANVFKIALN